MNYTISQKIIFSSIIFLSEAVYTFRQIFYFNNLLKQSGISREPYLGAILLLTLFGIITSTLFIISLSSIRNKSQNRNVIFIISIITIVISIIIFSPYVSSLSSLECKVTLGC